MKPFGKLLAELRKKAGLSQNDLAQIIKTNPTHISKIERGERNPPKMDTLIEIAKALGIYKNKKKMSEFISSALFSRKSLKNQTYSSPLLEDDIAVLMNKKEKREIYESPAIKLIAEILSDPSISKKDKDEIEKQIVSFVGWLKEKLEK